jgi:hypothetical protein
MARLRRRNLRGIRTAEVERPHDSAVGTKGQSGESGLALAAAAGTATEKASAASTATAATAGSAAEDPSAAGSAAVNDVVRGLSHGHRLSPNP